MFLTAEFPQFQVRLPPLHYWDHVVGKSTSIGTAYAEVNIIDRKRLFGFKHMDRAKCVIGKKGYLVVYKSIADRIGYSLDLTTAYALIVTEKIDSHGSLVSDMQQS